LTNFAEKTILLVEKMEKVGEWKSGKVEKREGI